MKTRNSELLKDFTKYCEDNPDERFWQALRNWSNSESIYRKNYDNVIQDTFYWECLDY